MIRIELPPKRRRGRPRKSETSTLKLAETSTPKLTETSTPKLTETSTPKLAEKTNGTTYTRHRGQFSKKPTIEEEEGDDASYHPTESDQLEEGYEDAEEDSEIGALAWGLITAGGLGYGSAAVYRAEIMAR